MGQKPFRLRQKPPYYENKINDDQIDGIHKLEKKNNTTNNMFNFITCPISYFIMKARKEHYGSEIQKDPFMMADLTNVHIGSRGSHVS